MNMNSIMILSLISSLASGPSTCFSARTNIAFESQKNNSEPELKKSQEQQNELQKKLDRKKAIILAAAGVVTLALIPLLLSDTAARKALIATGKHIGEKVISGTCYFFDCMLQGISKA